MIDPIKNLRSMALRLPNTEEGIACEGTALEKRTIKTGGKAFLFLGTSDAMLKLGDSKDEARRLAARKPDLYKIGATGWATVRFGPDRNPPARLMKLWIEESYRLMTPLVGHAKARPKHQPGKR